jgi:hypothetical protein
MSIIRRQYANLYNRSPAVLKRVLKRTTSFILRKPTFRRVNVSVEKPFPSGEKGGMVLSADFELAWAWRYAKGFQNPLKKASEMAKNARENFPYLLNILNVCGIPVTWATVGHLFLKECEKGSHERMRKIPYFENRNWQFKTGDWFDGDPYTSWREAVDWYAPDIIEKIISSNNKHEIGCHSFSHIDCSYENCPPGVMEDEVKACIEAAKPFGITFKSFVFPGGTYGNYEILKKHGFLAYRKKIKYELGYPAEDAHGLIVLPSSIGLGGINSGRSVEYYLKLFEKYIDKAIKTGTICHFWFHPSLDRWFLMNVFPELMKYACEKRDKGLLWIGTMEQAARLHTHKMK